MCKAQCKWFHVFASWMTRLKWKRCDDAKCVRWYWKMTGLQRDSISSTFLALLNYSILFRILLRDFFQKLADLGKRKYSKSLRFPISVFLLRDFNQLSATVLKSLKNDDNSNSFTFNRFLITIYFFACLENGRYHSSLQMYASCNRWQLDRLDSNSLEPIRVKKVEKGGSCAQFVGQLRIQHCDKIYFW